MWDINKRLPVLIKPEYYDVIRKLCWGLGLLGRTGPHTSLPTAAALH